MKGLGLMLCFGPEGGDVGHVGCAHNEEARAFC
jgi:hypothetical protein